MKHSGKLSSLKFIFDQILHKVVKKIYSGDIGIPLSQHSHEHVLLLLPDIAHLQTLTVTRADRIQANLRNVGYKLGLLADCDSLDSSGD